MEGAIGEPPVAHSARVGSALPGAACTQCARTTLRQHSRRVFWGATHETSWWEEGLAEVRAAGEAAMLPRPLAGVGSQEVMRGRTGEAEALLATQQLSVRTYELERRRAGIESTRRRALTAHGNPMQGSPGAAEAARSWPNRSVPKTPRMASLV